MTGVTSLWRCVLLCGLVALFAGTALAGVFSLIQAAPAGSGEWEVQGTGLGGASVYALAVNPQITDTLYAGVDFGIYKSIDGGLSWSEKSTGLPSMGEKGSEVREILVYPITPTIVYVGVPPLASYLPGGVFKSEDGGEHWVRTSEGMSYSNEDILSLAMDVSNPDVMYAGMIFDGVYKTTDGGANWSPANQGLPQQYRTVRELAVDPKQPSVVYAGLEGRLYRSANGGATWNPTSLEQTVTVMVFDPAASGTIYVGTEGWGVSRSVDGGGTWENLTMLGSASGRAYVYDLEYDAHARTLVAATMNGVEFGLDSPNRLGGSRLSAYVVNSYGVYALCFTQTCPPIGAYTVFIPAVSR